MMGVSGQGGSPRTYSVRTHLLVFAFIVAFPIIVLAGILLVNAARLKAAETEASLVDVAHALAENIDLDLDRKFTLLQTLAALPSLREEDWQLFHRQAGSAVQDEGYVIVVDPELRQLVNTYVPYGAAPAFTGDPETAQRMLRLQSAAVSDLFISLVTNGPVYNVNIPIFEDSELRFILILGQKTESLIPILRTGTVYQEWLRIVIDGNGAILARSGSDERLLGTESAELQYILESSSPALQRGFSTDGIPIYQAVSHSSLSEWSVVVIVPALFVEAPIWRTVRLWGGIASSALVLAAALAVFFAQYLSKPISRAAHAANLLAAGEHVSPIESSLVEANSVVRALADASTQLKDRERYQELLLKEVNHRVKNILAVVAALISRSLSGEKPLAECRENALSRVRALARAQDHLIQKNWKGASIRAFVHDELVLFSDRFEMNGTDFTVAADKVQTLTLTLYELATNAVKYGAWSNDSGAVLVTWSIADKRFKFRWEERGGPLIQQPEHAGFGTKLLRQSFDNGTCSPQLMFARTGIIYEFEIAASLILADEEGDSGLDTRTAIGRATP